MPSRLPIIYRLLLSFYLDDSDAVDADTMAGSIVAWVNMCSDFFAREPTVLKFSTMKYAVHAHGTFLVVCWISPAEFSSVLTIAGWGLLINGQALSGSLVENDGILKHQLSSLLSTFKFFYGSFELEKAVCRTSHH